MREAAVLAVVAACATLALAGSWEAPPEEAARPNPRPATEESLRNGRGLFEETCALCHGASGAGDPDMSETLGVTVGDLTDRQAMDRRTDGALHWRIRAGDDVMPPFADLFEDDAIWDVVNYLRTLTVDPPAEGPAAAPHTPR